MVFDMSKPVLFFVFAIVLLAQAVPLPVKAEDDTRKTRISRPVPTVDNSESANSADANAIKSNVLGLSGRWWRKFKNPSFCPFVICGSSCADISGIPRIGAYNQEELMSGDTPCGLNELNALEKPSSCCMPETVEKSYSCSDGACSEEKK